MEFLGGKVALNIVNGFEVSLETQLTLVLANKKGFGGQGR